MNMDKDEEEQGLIAEASPSPSKSRRFRLLGLGGSALAIAALVTVSSDKASLKASVANTIGESGACSADGENCYETKCCSTPGSTCFRKNEGWASCNQTCSENSLWVNDHFETKDYKVWDCAPLSCTQNGQNCMDSRCCSDPSSKCFLKNDEWASCNATCSVNNLWVTDHWEDSGSKKWDCSVLSCKKNGENCMDSKCCSEPGMTCYKKNDEWASCNATCSPNYLWNQQNGGWEKQDKAYWACDVLGGGSGPGLSECLANTTAACNGCQGEQCSYCTWDSKLECCTENRCRGCSGAECGTCRERKHEECCTSMNIPSGYCGAKKDALCLEKVPLACKGASGQAAEACVLDGKFECCLESKCGDHADVDKCREESTGTCCEQLDAPKWYGKCTTPKEVCSAKVELKCSGCSGESCSYCRWDGKLECCMNDVCPGGDDKCKGLSHTKCCKEAGITGGYKNCV